MVKRVKIIHRITGTPMWVADAEVDKFLAAGHKLAAQVPSEKPAKAEVKKVDEPAKEEKPEVKKAPVKKAKK